MSALQQLMLAGGATLHEAYYYSDTTGVVIPANTVISFWGYGAARTNSPYVSAYNLTSIWNNRVTNLGSFDQAATISGYPASVPAHFPTFSFTLSFSSFTDPGIGKTVPGNSFSLTSYYNGPEYVNGGSTGPFGFSYVEGGSGNYYIYATLLYDTPVYSDSWSDGAQAQASLNGANTYFAGEPAGGGGQTPSTGSINSGSDTTLDVYVPAGGVVKVSYYT